jgi:outer membrane protein
VSARAAAAWTAAAVIAGAGVGARAQDVGRPILSLDAAITEALDHSPALGHDLEAVALADIGRRQAAAAFATRITPSVATTTDPIAGQLRSAGVTITKNLSTGGQVFFAAQALSAGAAAGGIRTAQYSVGLSQPLLRGFGRTAMAGLVDADRARTSAARALAAARAALVVDVARRYFAVVKAQRVLTAATAAASRAATLTAASRARTAVGLATQLDVLRAEVEQSHVAARVGAARTSLASAEDDLSEILGRRPAPPLEVDVGLDLADLARRLPPLPDRLDDLVAGALARRQDVTEARDRVRDAVRAADVARWNLAPPLSLDLSYTERGLRVPGPVPSTTLAGGWHVGLSTSYSIDRAGEAAAASTARVASDAAARAAEEVALGAEADIRRSYRAWQAASASVEIERNAVELAQRELDLANLRLARGLGDTLDVIAAQDSLLQAQTTLTEAELDRGLLAIDLRRAAGLLQDGLWAT